MIVNEAYWESGNLNYNVFMMYRKSLQYDSLVYIKFAYMLVANEYPFHSISDTCDSRLQYYKKAPKFNVPECIPI